MYICIQRERDVYINICVEKYVYEEIDCPEILNNPISPNTLAQTFIDMFP